MIYWSTSSWSWPLIDIYIYYHFGAANCCERQKTWTCSSIPPATATCFTKLAVGSVGQSVGMRRCVVGKTPSNDQVGPPGLWMLYIHRFVSGDFFTDYTMVVETTIKPRFGRIFLDFFSKQLMQIQVRNAVYRGRNATHLQWGCSHGIIRIPSWAKQDSWNVLSGFGTLLTCQ